MLSGEMASALRGYPDEYREHVLSFREYLHFRDLTEHFHIKSPVEVVRFFLKRVMENLTKPTSVNKIYNELKSAGLKVSKDYLYEWLDDACRDLSL